MPAGERSGPLPSACPEPEVGQGSFVYGNRVPCWTEAQQWASWRNSPAGPVAVCGKSEGEPTHNQWRMPVSSRQCKCGGNSYSPHPEQEGCRMKGDSSGTLPSFPHDRREIDRFYNQSVGAALAHSRPSRSPAYFAHHAETEIMVVGSIGRVTATSRATPRGERVPAAAPNHT